MRDITFITFTEYLLPRGRHQEITLRCSGKYSYIVDKVLEVGWRFECEKLRTGQYSLTITSDEQDEFFAITPKEFDDITPYVNDLLRQYRSEML